MLHLMIAVLTFLFSASVTGIWNSFAKSSRFAEVSLEFPSERNDRRPHSTSAVEQELLDIIREYDAAQTNHDAVFFENLETKDFLLTYSDGTTYTRNEAIASMKTRDPALKYVSDDVAVESYGNSAVVSGRMTEISPKGDRYYWRWVDIFIKRDGRWKIISTRIED